MAENKQKYTGHCAPEMQKLGSETAVMPLRDGAHASPAGSDFAAKMIQAKIYHDLCKRK